MRMFNTALYRHRARGMGSAEWGVRCLSQVKVRAAWVNRLCSRPACTVCRVIWECRPSLSRSLAPHCGVQDSACWSYSSASLSCSFIGSLMLWAIGCCKPQMLRDSFSRICFMSEELIDKMVGIFYVTMCTPAHIACFQFSLPWAANTPIESMKVHFKGIANLSI